MSKVNCNLLSFTKFVHIISIQCCCIVKNNTTTFLSAAVCGALCCCDDIVCFCVQYSLVIFRFIDCYRYIWSTYRVYCESIDRGCSNWLVDVAKLKPVSKMHIYMYVHNTQICCIIYIYIYNPIVLINKNNCFLITIVV